MPEADTLPLEIFHPLRLIELRAAILYGAGDRRSAAKLSLLADNTRAASLHPRPSLLDAAQPLLHRRGSLQGRVLFGSAALADRSQAVRSGPRPLERAAVARCHDTDQGSCPLRGVLFDADGHSMVPTDATKQGIRGRYCASQPYIRGLTKPPLGASSVSPPQSLRMSSPRRCRTVRSRTNLRGDWGDWRAPIVPEPGTEVYGRSGFFLHGRILKGSKVYIDIGVGLFGNALTDQLLSDILNHPTPRIPLTVNR